MVAVGMGITVGVGIGSVSCACTDEAVNNKAITQANPIMVIFFSMLFMLSPLFSLCERKALRHDASDTAPREDAT
jgi:hypothetical protein